jgi:acetyl-CoA C-acetyltransferase
MKTVYIVSAKRTATGGYLGQLSSHSATQLGSIAIQAALEAISLPKEAITSVYMGNGVSAGLGQSPARQATLGAGLPLSTDATTINKVCASGMKAITLAAQQIQLGLEHLVVAGGMESMSNAPHYTMIRKGQKLGDARMTDGLLHDGLTDAYDHLHMGNAAEKTVRKFKLSRQAQDDYALQSYARAQAASEQQKFTSEITPVSIKTKQGELSFDVDEDIHKLIPEKVPQLKPSFEKEGTITPANASNLNDGAAALVLASEEAVKQYQLKPLARIVAYADAAVAPVDFSIAPATAIQRLLKSQQMQLKDIDFIELNEAYAAVVLANQQLLGFDLENTNVYGGAIALGHPIGASGARITTTLLSVLQQEGGKLGLAAICNGGGGATALLVERSE